MKQRTQKSIIYYENKSGTCGGGRGEGWITVAATQLYTTEHKFNTLWRLVGRKKKNPIALLLMIFMFLPEPGDLVTLYKRRLSLLLLEGKKS